MLAVLLWLAGSSILSWYLANFEDYNATYGSLGAAIGLMIWMAALALGLAAMRREEPTPPTDPPIASVFCPECWQREFGSSG